MHEFGQFHVLSLRISGGRAQCRASYCANTTICSHTHSSDRWINSGLREQLGYTQENRTGDLVTAVSNEGLVVVTKQASCLQFACIAGTTEGVYSTVRVFSILISFGSTYLSGLDIHLLQIRKYTCKATHCTAKSKNLTSLHIQPNRKLFQMTVTDLTEMYILCWCSIFSKQSSIWVATWNADPL
jgi:hypothetical protein